MYKEYSPHSILAQYIETYWVSHGFIEKEETQRILPDGCVDIIFSLNDVNTLYGMQSFVVGTMTSALDVMYKGEVKMVGIRFRPCGITAFSRVPICDITNQRIEFDSFDTILDKSFYERVDEMTTIEEVLSHIDCYLLQQLPSLFDVDERVSYAVSVIEQSKGNILIPTLADKACLSERQFERRFKSSIGISAKRFSRIIKFRNAVDYLKSNSDQSLFEVSFNCGYYDHSHLIKEFKSLSGSLPLELIV